MTPSTPSHHGDASTKPHPPITPTSIPHPQTPLQHALVITHYIYPLFLLVFFLGALTWWGIRLASKKQPSPPPPPPRTSNGALDGSADETESDRLLGKNLYDDHPPRIGIWGRTKTKFVAWFNGELEGAPSSWGKNPDLDDSVGPQYKGLTPLRKAIMSWGVLVIILSFIAESVNIILHALVKTGWWCGQDVVVSTSLAH